MFYFFTIKNLTKDQTTTFTVKWHPKILFSCIVIEPRAKDVFPGILNNQATLSDSISNGQNSSSTVQLTSTFRQRKSSTTDYRSNAKKRKGSKLLKHKPRQKKTANDLYEIGSSSEIDSCIEINTSNENDSSNEKNSSSETALPMSSLNLNDQYTTAGSCQSNTTILQTSLSNSRPPVLPSLTATIRSKSNLKFSLRKKVSS